MSHFLLLILCLTFLFASPGELAAQSDSAFTYQGRLNTSGAPAGGPHDFTFGLYATADGTSQIGTTVTQSSVNVDGGLFSVDLDFGADAFDGSRRWLETTVAPAASSEVTTLWPRTPVSPAPFSVFAAKTTPIQQTRLVAKSGGDFTSVQQALNSITDAESNNRYVIRIAPGVYQEKVTLKPWVALEGMSRDQVVLSWGGSFISPITSSQSATVIGSANASISGLTIESVGAAYTVGLQHSAGSMNASNVKFEARNGSHNYPVVQLGGELAMTQCVFSATGGANRFAVYAVNSIATLTNCTVRSSAGSSLAVGLHISSSSLVVRASSITAENGNLAYGAHVSGSSQLLMSEVVCQASGAPTNYSLYTAGSSLCSVRNSELVGTLQRGISTTMQLASCQITGTLSSGITCFNNHDASMNPVTCP